MIPANAIRIRAAGVDAPGTGGSLAPDWATGIMRPNGCHQGFEVVAPGSMDHSLRADRKEFPVSPRRPLCPAPAMSNVIAPLRQLEADYSVFYRKLRAFHWNVQGPAFFTLHVKFEELYNGFNLKVDALAERVLTLGGLPIPTYQGVLDTARLAEQSDMPDAVTMVEELYSDLKKLNQWTREVIAVADEASDIGSASMLEDFAVEGEKEAWMLRSFLGKSESVNA